MPQQQCFGGHYENPAYNAEERGVQNPTCNAQADESRQQRPANNRHLGTDWTRKFGLCIQTDIWRIKEGGSHKSGYHRNHHDSLSHSLFNSLKSSLVSPIRLSFSSLCPL